MVLTYLLSSLEQTKQIGFPTTRKLYNVSENTIGKWIKAYHKGLG